MEYFLARVLRTLSFYLLDLIQALIVGQKNLEYFFFFKPSKILYY